MEQGTESGPQARNAPGGLVGHPTLVAKSSSRRSAGRRRSHQPGGNLAGEPAAPSLREPQSSLPVVLALVLLFLVLFG